MTEKRDEFGPLTVVVTDEVVSAGGYEIQYMDDKDNIEDIDTVPPTFYREQHWKGRIRNKLEDKVNEKGTPDGFDFEKEWSKLKKEWVGHFRVVEHEKKKGEGKSEENKVDEEIVEESERLLRDPSLLLEINDVIHDYLATEHQNALLCFLCMISTLAEEPVNLKFSGRSSTGKSAIVTAAMKTLPESRLMAFTGLTEKALYYDPNAERNSDGEKEIDLSGKILIILEESNARKFLQEAKPLLSHDRKRQTYGFTDTSGDETIRRDIVLKGWPSYIGLTVNPEESVEHGTRELMTMPEIGEEKYSSVVNWKAKQKYIPSQENSEKKLEILKHSISELERKKVWIPFIPEIRENFQTYRARSQRDWDKLISIIETMTILHQHQRPKLESDDEELVISHPYDAIAALEILDSALTQAKLGLNEDQTRFHKHIMERSNTLSKEWWTYRELMEEYQKAFGESITRATVQRRYVDSLVERGLLKKDKSQKTHKISTSSGINFSKVSKFDEMREKVSNIDFNEDYLRKQLCRANELGDVPEPKWEIVEGECDLGGIDMYKDELSNLRQLIGESSDKREVNWEMEGLEGSKEKIEEKIPELSELGEGEKEPEEKNLSQKDLVQSLSEFYDGFQNPPKKAVLVREFMSHHNVSKPRIEEAVERLEEDGYFFPPEGDGPDEAS